MSNYPDWSNHGYQILSELGHNSLGGRVTYKAQQTNTQQQVVIKQFQFTAIGSTWAEYETCEQEMTLLRNINHPNIPRYLDTFQTPDGLCIVQEYIEAQSLAVPRRWTPQNIKKVALSVLRILAYLQRQNPPIIHRDIKPENILIDEKLNVYLVDFGFARSGGGEVAASSVVKGTMGFMPPEQLFNRELTTASDLYGLGVTLICLLTGTKSADIGNLIDTNYSLHFQHLVPPLKRGWVSWLQKMVEPRVQDRYANAAEALAALKPIDVDRLPKVRLIQDTLKFTCRQYGEKLTQTVSISNPIPDTMLAGRWEVAPHPSDPPHTPYDHSWISFSPQKFEGNEVECEITVDTSKLLAEETYIREIVLRSNSSPETNRITVQVKTPRLPKHQKPAYFMLLGLSAISWMPLLVVNLFAQPSPLWNSVFFVVLLMFFPAFVAWDKIAMATAAGNEIGIGNRLKAGISGVLGAVLTVVCSMIVMGIFDPQMANEVMWWVLFSVGIAVGTMWGASFGVNHKRHRKFDIIALFVALSILALILFAALGLGFVGVAIAIFVGWLGYEEIWRLIQGAITYQIKKGFEPKEASQAVLLSLGLGICSELLTLASLPLLFELVNPTGELTDKIIVVLLALVPVLTIVFLLSKLISRSLKNNQLITQYLNDQPNLIKP